MQTRGTAAEPGTVNAQLNELSAAEQMAVTMKQQFALTRQKANESYDMSVSKD